MTDVVGTDFERGQRQAEATASAMMQAWDDAFFNAFKGRWDDMEDVVENFADNMLRILSRRFSEDAMNLIFGSQGSGGSPTWCARPFVHHRWCHGLARPLGHPCGIHRRIVHR